MYCEYIFTVITSNTFHYGSNCWIVASLPYNNAQFLSRFPCNSLNIAKKTKISSKFFINNLIAVAPTANISKLHVKSLNGTQLKVSWHERKLKVRSVFRLLPWKFVFTLSALPPTNFHFSWCSVHSFQSFFPVLPLRWYIFFYSVQNRYCN